ncbi:MAG: TfoX/Sxy family protein [Chloroflexi bacterium]|nr:TfoX/Sxy family protein [Chloroflexota bacterium]
MKWEKAPESLVQTFDAALPEDARVERRKMFGYPCAFVGGNMFAGLHEARLIVRLPEEARETLLALEGACSFEPMAGRPMREYVVVPPQVVADPAALREWVGQAFTYGSTLAPKSGEKRTGDRKSRSRR